VSAEGAEVSAPVLRPYQYEAIGAYEQAVTFGSTSVLMVGPTGSGKTIILAAIIRTAVACYGQRVLFFSHRKEITRQTLQKLFDLGIDAGVIQAGWPARPDQQVQVASIQTLDARAIRGSAIELPPADLVIVDEAHHARAETYRKVLEKFPDAIKLGFTATPCRKDGRGLGNIFEKLIECPQVQELIDLKFLVPPNVYAPVTPDLKGVRVQAGDYVEKQLAERMDTAVLVGGIIEHQQRHAKGRPTTVFATSVAHSIHIRDEFLKAGVKAEHLDGTTPAEERDAILKRLAGGDTEVVCNCAVLTEGLGLPRGELHRPGPPHEVLGHAPPDDRTRAPPGGRQDRLHHPRPQRRRLSAWPAARPDNLGSAPGSQGGESQT
jgi:DNA repair protein RadD